MVTMDDYLLEYLRSDLDTALTRLGKANEMLVNYHDKSIEFAEWDELYRTVFTASLSVFRARETLNDVVPMKAENQ